MLERPNSKLPPKNYGGKTGIFPSKIFPVQDLFLGIWVLSVGIAQRTDYSSEFIGSQFCINILPSLSYFCTKNRNHWTLLNIWPVRLGGWMPRWRWPGRWRASPSRFVSGPPAKASLQPITDEGTAQSANHRWGGSIYNHLRGGMTASERRDGTFVSQSLRTLKKNNMS